MKTYLPNKPSSWKLILAFGAVYVIWGSTYLAIKIALESFPPFTLAGLRFLTAGLLLLGLCKLNRKEIPSSREIIQISFTGILLLFFGSGSVIWVEQYLNSSLTAIIWATLPFWFILLNKSRWTANNLNFKSIIGLVLGFIGVLFLMGDDEVLNIIISTNSLISFIIAFSGTIIFAIGSLYMKNKPTRSTSNTTASIQLIAAGLLSLLVSIVIGEPRQIIFSKISFESILSLIYLISMGSMIAYLSYVWLISVISPEIVGTYTYVNPIVAIILGWSVLHETISLQQVIALSLILFGVCFINLYQPKIKSHDCKNMARYSS